MAAHPRWAEHHPRRLRSATMPSIPPSPRSRSFAYLSIAVVACLLAVGLASCSKKGTAPTYGGTTTGGGGGGGTTPELNGNLASGATYAHQFTAAGAFN